MNQILRFGFLVFAFVLRAQVPTAQQLLDIATGKEFVAHVVWTSGHTNAAPQRYRGALQDGTFFVQTYNLPKREDEQSRIVEGQNCEHDWRLVGTTLNVGPRSTARVVPEQVDPSPRVWSAYVGLRSAVTFGTQYIGPGPLEEKSPGTYSLITDPRVTMPATNATVTLRTDSQGRVTGTTHKVAPHWRPYSQTITYGPDGGFPVVIQADSGHRMTILEMTLGKTNIADPCGFRPTMFTNQPIFTTMVWSNAYPYVLDPDGEMVPVPKNRRLHIAPGQGDQPGR
jgi:hypothetical protein